MESFARMDLARLQTGVQRLHEWVISWIDDGMCALVICSPRDDGLSDMRVQPSQSLSFIRWTYKLELKNTNYLKPQ